ncbi:MAG: exo-alpha-sialidase [Alphaproteobacteria bacterium]|nr:exo-alpha-sialidase [Alphaproteobacteria bacterium]
MALDVLVATRKGFVRLARKGKAWAQAPAAFVGSPVSAFLDDARDGRLYAALRLGHFGVKLHRSEDGGATWTELPAPAFPAAPAAAEPPAGGEKAPAVDMIWTLAAGGAPGELWAGALPAGLFRSIDRGASWSLVESLWNVPERKEWFGGGYDHAGIHSVHADPRDPRRLTIAISSGGVWKSDDAGAAWRHVGKGLRAEYMPPARAYELNVQDPHRLAHCAAAPDVAWCQHHNGMFRSTDGGTTFEEIKGVKPSVFGFAVAAHPRDPLTAWFAPAVKDECRVPVDGKLVVTRTRDGGKSFEAFGDGLPAAGCFDLIYRHALAVDGSGERLVMGSTTGNLWVSEDAGRSWMHVAGHLPPIAQVAFA